MAYNTYFPATYQPMVNQNMFQNPYAQQQMQMQQQAQQQNQAMQTPGIIWVSGDQEADAFPLAPNTAVPLWHRTLPVIYFKSADASGRPSMKVYDYTERKPQTQQEVSVEQTSYATKDDFHTMEDAIKSLRADVRFLKKELKKQEVVEDDAE